MQRRLAAGIGALVVAALALTGCSASSAPPTTAKKITIGIPYGASSITWDPDAAAMGGLEQVWSAVYDRLVVQDDKVGIDPALATSWKYSDGNTTLTLTLRSGVKFTDGTAVDSAAIKANYEHWQTPASIASGLISKVTSVDTPNATTVVMHLASPSSELLENLGQLPVASPKVLKNPDLLTATPVGSGPYTLDVKNTTSDVKYTFVRNPHYWNAKNYAYDSIVFLTLPEVTARLNALKSGQIDATQLDPTVATEAKGSGLTVQTYPAAWVGLSLQDIEGKVLSPLADLRVRQAINYAFDRAAIVKALDAGIGEPSDQIFAKGQPEYQAGTKYPFDPTKAKKLLADAGYPHGFDLTIPSTATLTGRYEAVIAQQLGDIGITVKWDEKPDISGLAAAWFSPTVPVTLTFGTFYNTEDQYVGANGLFNPWHRQTTEVTDLLAKTDTGSAADQAAVQQKIGKYVRDNAWFAPIYHTESVWATSSKVTSKVQLVNSAAPQLRFITPSN